MCSSRDLGEVQLRLVRLRMSLGLFLVVLLNSYDTIIPYSVEALFRFQNPTSFGITYLTLMIVPFMSYVIIVSTFRFVDTNLRITIPLIWVLIHFIRVGLPPDIARGFMVLALIVLTILFSYIIAKSNL